MSSLATSMPFGMNMIKLTSYTDAGATILGASSVELPYAQTMKYSEAEDFETLRGNDKNLTFRGKGPSLTFELGAGGLNLPAYAMVAGGAVALTGTTPSRIQKYSATDTKVRPWFKAEGRSMSDSGGDVHPVLYRLRASDSLDAEFSDGTYYITSIKGMGIGSAVSSSLGALYDIVQNETATAIV